MTERKAMDKPQPSTQWTVEERLQVVNWISYQLHQRRHAAPPEVDNIADRLQCLAVAEREWLEDNRSNIIDGWWLG